MSRQRKPTLVPHKCKWCNELDQSVGKDPITPDSCFTCSYVRENVVLIVNTERGRAFIRGVLDGATQEAGVSGD